MWQISPSDPYIVGGGADPTSGSLPTPNDGGECTFVGGLQTGQFFVGCTAMKDGSPLAAEILVHLDGNWTPVTGIPKGLLRVKGINGSSPDDLYVTAIAGATFDNPSSSGVIYHVTNGFMDWKQVTFTDGPTNAMTFGPIYSPSAGMALIGSDTGSLVMVAPDDTATRKPLSGANSLVQFWQAAGSSMLHVVSASGLHFSGPCP